MYEFVRIDPEVCCYFVKWTALPSPAHFEAFLGEVRRLPGFEPDFHSFNDLRGVDMNVSAKDMRCLADTRSKATGIGVGKRAMIVDEGLAFGMLRMFSAYLETIPGQFRVFRDSKQAMRWIELPEDYVLPF